MCPYYAINDPTWNIMVASSHANAVVYNAVNNAHRHLPDSWRMAMQVGMHGI